MKICEDPDIDKFVEEISIKHLTTNLPLTKLQIHCHMLRDCLGTFIQLIKDKQCTYSVTLRRVRATIAAVEKR